MMENDIQNYISSMEEIKRRIAVISDFITRKSTTGYLMTDVEFMCLQFRKVLELIALSSLSADREKYDEISERFHRGGNVEEIIGQLERINPDFYPIPTMKAAYDKEGRFKKVERIVDGFLGREEFLKLLDTCAGFLHAVNPFKNNMPTNPQDMWGMFEEWERKIKALLNYHQVQLINEKEPFWVIMQATTDAKAHVYKLREKETNG